ncbi:MAG: ATP-binding cassette domain-containing protein, partial [Elusimicrobia bacterium]|nr:ATP-binding cassette domain-containing protein [Elusimicrobiota bacterium]
MEIRLEGVAKAYPGLRLGPVDLVVPSGSLIVLEGANGSGKTTLLEIVAGTVEPDAGEVRLGGRRVFGLAPSDRGVFYVPQVLHKFWSMQHPSRFCFIPRRTVRENLLAAARAPAEAGEWLARLGLEGYADETPERLSFGLQQRLALARAVLARPGVILVDEGFSSLDPGVRGGMFDALRAVPERTGNTVVYVTHHADDAARLGGASYRVRDGRLSPLAAGTGAGATKARLAAAFTALLDFYRESTERGGESAGSAAVARALD